MIETHITARLKAVAAVTALVGERVYPHHIPQRAVLPALSYTRLSGAPEHAMGADVDMRSARLQVSCWSREYNEAKSLALAVRGALSRYRGTVGASEILDSLEEAELDDYDPATYTYQVIVDFLIWYRE